METARENVSGIRKGWFFILLVTALLLGASWLVRWMAGRVPEGTPVMEVAGQPDQPEGAIGKAASQPLVPNSPAETKEANTQPEVTGEVAENQKAGGDSVAPPGSPETLEPEEEEALPEEMGQPVAEKIAVQPAGTEIDTKETHEAPLVPPDLCLLAENAMPTIPTESTFALHLPSGISVRAAAAGRLVKLMDNPFSGKSLYLLSDEGHFAFKYEGLEAYAENAMEGQAVGCGDPLGITAKADANQRSRFSMLKIPIGSSWWQGTPVDLSPYSAQLCGERKPNTD